MYIQSGGRLLFSVLRRTDLPFYCSMQFFIFLSVFLLTRLISVLFSKLLNDGYRQKTYDRKWIVWSVSVAGLVIR